MMQKSMIIYRRETHRKALEKEGVRAFDLKRTAL
jgi:hypothetical protein